MIEGDNAMSFKISFAEHCIVPACASMTIILLDSFNGIGVEGLAMELIVRKLAAKKVLS